MKEAKSMENSEWKEVKLRDITTKLGSGATPRGGSNTYKDEGISLIRSQNVLDLKFSKNGLVLIDEEQAHNLKNVIIEEQDILLNITGDSVARACMVPNKILPARVNQHVSIIRADRDIVHPKYILYNLISQKEELLLQSEIGATRKAITKGMLEKLELIIPPLPEQTAIASILSSLDDKIDLLHRQNTTLEKMAETLFRQWFVEEAKEEWEEIKITDLFEVRDGTHDSPKQKESDKKLITSKHLSKHSIDFQSAYSISEEDFEQINRRSKVETDDILFSMIGTIGIIYLEQSKKINYAIKNIGLFKTSQNSFWKYFTVLWLKSNLGDEFIYENRSGSTQEYISLGSLRSITFSIPSIQTVELFNGEIESLFKKMQLNQTQIRTLTALRDTLLPKLMSGEVRVQL